jgi:sugar phosphate permease
MVTIASAFCAVGSLLFGLSSSLWEAKFGRFFIGIGASFAFVTCLKLASTWFSANRCAFLTGLTGMVGFMGSVFGLSTVNKAVEYLGWRQSMQWGGWIGLALSVVLWWVIRDKPTSSTAKVVAKTASTAQVINKNTLSSSEIMKGLLQIVKNKRTWLVALYAGLMFVPTLAFGGLWGVPFFVEAHGFDRNTAGACVSLIFLGWVFGSPLWGYVSDYLGKRKLPMIISNVVTLIVCVAIIYLKHLPLYGLNILLFSLGFFSSGFLLAFTVVQESNPKHLSGTAIGFTNALNTFFGAVAQPLIGKVLDGSGTGVLASGAERVFTLGEYQQAFITLPICLVVSLVLILFLKEKRS